MLSVQLCMAVLAAIATASPVSRRSSSGGTSLPLRRIQRHPHSLVRRDASEIIPQGQNPALLVLDVDIGTPPQTIPVQIDTGSSTLWVVGKEAPGTNNPPITFDQDKSSTWSQVPISEHRMSVAYVDGSGASGVYGNDTIVVAGSSATWEVGVAITENTAYTADDIVSGIIGMSYGNPEENSTRVDRTSNPAWWAFVHEWTNEEFGLYVAPPENVTSYVDWTTHPRGSETELGGLLTLGGVEENLFKDKLNYVPIVNGTAGVDWEIPVDAVNGVAVDRTTAFIDSGTSFLMGPTDQIRQGLLGQNVDARLDTVGDGSQYFTYSCQYANSIEWTFTFGGQNYTIPSQYLSQEFDGLGRCMFVIVPDSENNYYIVGDAFLYGVYSAYRAGNNPAVGLAHVSDDAQKWLAAYSKNGGVEPSGFVSDSASATGSGSASKPSSSTVSSNNAAGALAPSFGALLVASLAAFFL